MRSEVRKNGRMVSPEDVARRLMKAEKSMTVTTAPDAAGIGGDFSRHAYLNPSRSAPGREPRRLVFWMRNLIARPTDFLSLSCITKARAKLLAGRCKSATGG